LTWAQAADEDSVRIKAAFTDLISFLLAFHSSDPDLLSNIFLAFSAYEQGKSRAAILSKEYLASRGMSVQEAVHQALRSWAEESRSFAPEPLDALEGSLADVDIQGLLRREKEIELRLD